jgi:hypothetical protein
VNIKVVSIKGRIAELGPRLELAPAGWVYLGRPNHRGKNRGGWDLDGSPFANPFSVTRYGPDEAYARFQEYLLDHPDLIDQAVRELAGAAAYCCWCADLDKCHASFVATIVGAHSAVARHDFNEGACTEPLMPVPTFAEDVVPAGDWVGAL